MTAIIIACFFICFLWKVLSFLTNDSEAKRSPDTDNTDSRRQMISLAMDKAEMYNASSFKVGRTWIGDDGHEYVDCTITVDDDVAKALAQDLRDEYGNVIEKIGITYNNKKENMENNEPTTQFIIYGNFNGTARGNVTNNNYGDTAQKSSSEQAIREALQKLMTVKNDKNQMLFRNGYQWYGVMRVLSQFLDYPSTPKEFASRIQRLGINSGSNPCNVENFRKMPNDCPRLAKPNVWLWKDYSETADGKEKEVIDAALKLMEILSL